MKYTVHTDGGSRGNPGPAAIGWHIDDGTQTIRERGRYIGMATNNTAEYAAVIDALEWIETHRDALRDANAFTFLLDSLLVVQQLNGIFKIKHDPIRVMVVKIRALEQGIGYPISYAYIPREENRRADALVNRALDSSAHVAS